MKLTNGKKMIVGSIIGIFLVTLIGGIFAFYAYSGTSSNQQLVVGDIYMRYTESSTNINVNNMFPRSTKPSNYFEFFVEGKNTTTDRDVIYDISITHGDLLQGKTRIRDEFLRFTLEEKKTGEESWTPVVENEQYSDISNGIEMYVDKILKNTTSEVTHAYRLYIWIDSEVIIYGGDITSEDGDYSFSEWNNLFASVKVNVTGDFTARQTGENVTVTFDSNGGTVLSNKKNVIYESEYGTLPEPTKDGYTFISWNCNRLPNDYQEVEYIQSNATSYTSGQYINTGLNITENTGFDIDFEIENDFVTSESGASWWGEILGNADTNWPTNFIELGTWTGKDLSGYFRMGGSTGGYADYAGLQKNVRLQASLRNRVYTNPLNQTTTISTNSFKSNGSLMVFARSWGGNMNAFSRMKLYSLKLYDGDTLIRDFVPCYRKSDDEVGLYDILNNVFYTNQGTGEFSKGVVVYKNVVTASTKVLINEDHTLYATWEYNPIVTFDASGGTVSPNTKTIKYNSEYGTLPEPTRVGYTFLGWKLNNNNYILPNGYQEVEYINFNNLTYIDTGIIPSNHMTEVKADFDASNKVLFSTDRSYNYYEIALWNNKYYWGTNGAQYYAGSWELDSGAHTFIYNDYNNSVIVDGTTLGTGYTITSTTNLLIGRRNIGFNDYPLNGKIYYFKVTDKSTGDLVRNMIPCYRISDNVIGMYDIVNDVFYTNSINGLFDMGNNVISKFITSSDKVITNEDHTLYAIWKKE